MKYPALLIACVLCGCSPQTEPLIVKQFTLRDQDTDVIDDPMVQNEKLGRLYGAVSMEERKNRLGQYFTVLWNDPNISNSKREILFQYQQGGSRVKTVTKSLPTGQSTGKEEFAIIGDDYFKNGRVLAWKIDFTANGKTIASKQSYLWE
ncbi:MAG: hypothetical protein RLZZ505_1487 [Verrucomicrobiota bacterium]|jgi:hypothetical protein